jgi:hypothetical protein
MLKKLTMTGLRKGLLGGDRAWTVVLVVAVGLRILGRLSRSEPEVVYCEELEPGQSLIIRHDAVTGA